MQSTTAEISDQTIQKWRKIVNVMARMYDAPAALIRQWREEGIAVLVSSQTGSNPYGEGDLFPYDRGIYCEMTVNKDGFFQIEGSDSEPLWGRNPDLMLNMSAYMGIPIKWPNGALFGVLCILDSQPFRNGVELKNTFLDFHDMVEEQLYLLALKKEKLEIEKSLKQSQEDVQNLNAQIMADRELLENISAADYLTGLYNRRYLYKYLEHHIDLARRYQRPLGVILLEIDDFKNINAALGNKRGDGVIVDVAESLKEHLMRKSDIAGRYGGNEFLIILPESELADTIKVADRIRTKVMHRDWELGGRRVTVSAGCAVWELEDLDAFVKKTDDLLQKAKLAGKNRVES